MYYNEKWWDKFKPITRGPGNTGDLPFYKTGLTGDYLRAWQMDHPGQPYMTPEEQEAMDQATSSGTMTASVGNPFQNMQTKGSRKKKKPGERDPPANNLFGPMGAGIGGLFGG